MGKIKRPSAVDGFASDVFRAPRYYIFKRSLPSPRRESLSTPNGSFSLCFVLSPSPVTLCLLTKEDRCTQGFASKEK